MKSLSDDPLREPDTQKLPKRLHACHDYFSLHMQHMLCNAQLLIFQSMSNFSVYEQSVLIGFIYSEHSDAAANILDTKNKKTSL